MRAAVEALADRLTFPLLTQSDLPKPALVEAFRSDESACLFATLGFWQGVDVPGRTLSLVTIDRIPFPRPDDPVLEARASWPGPGAFGAVDLPRAGTLLAQGAGRLIRSSARPGCGGRARQPSGHRPLPGRPAGAGAADEAHRSTATRWWRSWRTSPPRPSLSTPGTRLRWWPWPAAAPRRWITPTVDGRAHRRTCDRRVDRVAGSPERAVALTDGWVAKAQRRYGTRLVEDGQHHGGGGQAPRRRRRPPGALGLRLQVAREAPPAPRGTTTVTLERRVRGGPAPSSASDGPRRHGDLRRPRPRTWLRGRPRPGRPGHPRPPLVRECPASG